MAPSCTVRLPSGSLGLSFKNDTDNTPKISVVKDNSPLNGICKVGFTFIELELDNGTKLTGLNTNKLVSSLKKYSSDKQRKMKLEMTLPSSEDTNDGFTSLPIVSPKKKSESTTIPTVSIKTAELPNGNCKELGLSFIPSSDNLAKIAKITKSSPLIAEKERILGYVVDSMTIDHDGHSFCGLNCSELMACIDATSNEGKRVISFIHPKKKEEIKNDKKNGLLYHATIKLVLPTDITYLKDLGFDLFGASSTIIRAVSDYSPFKGTVFPNYRITKLILEDSGIEYDNLNSPELEEVLEASTSDFKKNQNDNTRGRRLLYLTNTPGPIVNCILPATIKNNSDTNYQNDVFCNSFLTDIFSAIITDTNNNNNKTTAKTTAIKNKLGIVFKGTPPRLVRINPSSPLLALQQENQDQQQKEENSIKGGIIEPNMVVDTLTLPTGAIYYQMTTADLINAIKSTAHLENRVIRLIRPDAGIRLTPQPIVLDSTEEGEMNIMLPRGKIGLVFKKGKSSPIVANVKKTSPLYGKVPSGGQMVVDYITIQNRKYMELTSNEACDILLATSDVPNRQIKLWEKDHAADMTAKVPDELEITLPAGKIGCTFAGTVPYLTTFHTNSLIDARDIPYGMFVDQIYINNTDISEENDEGGNDYYYSQTGMTTRELVSILKHLKYQEGRTLVFKNRKKQKPSPKEIILPPKMKLILPTGKLSLKLKKTKAYNEEMRTKDTAKINDKEVACISHIDMNSALLSSSGNTNAVVPYVGMIVDSIIVPDMDNTNDTIRYSGITHKEAVRILKDTNSISGRTMVLKSPQNYFHSSAPNYNTDSDDSGKYSSSADSIRASPNLTIRQI